MVGVDAGLAQAAEDRAVGGDLDCRHVGTCCPFPRWAATLGRMTDGPEKTRE